MLQFFAIFLLLNGLFAFINILKQDFKVDLLLIEERISIAIANIAVLVLSSAQLYFGLKFLGVFSS